MDSQGNLAGQDLASAAAEAQAMVALDDSAVIVSSALWAKGASAHAVRLLPSGAPLWTTAIAPSDPQDTARAHCVVAMAGDLLVAGHDVRFDLPAVSIPWIARIHSTTGKVVAKQALAPDTQGELVFAMATAGSQLWLAGQVQGGTTGPLPLLRLLGPLGGGVLPMDSTAIALKVGPGSLTGMATTGKGTVAVGWKTQPTLDALVLALEDGQLAWAYSPSQPGQQSLSAATVLSDGTIVAVGSRTAGSGAQAYWLRLAQDGATACVP